MTPRRRLTVSAAVSATMLAAAACAAAAPDATRPVAGAAPAAERARLHFVRYCSGCHLADGTGSPAKGIPTMHGTLDRLLRTPGGREFIVQVPGVMNSPLGDRDVADLMNWLVPWTSGGAMPPGHAPYTADEVARLRRTRPADVPAVRRALVARARDAGLEIDAPPAPRGAP